MSRVELNAMFRARGAVKSLDEIRAIKRRAEPWLLDLPGVVGVDIGRKIAGGKKTDTIAIRVYVEKKHDPPAEHAIPPEIEGVPTDVIQRRFRPH